MNKEKIKPKNVQQSYSSDKDLPALYGVPEGTCIKDGYFCVEKNQIKIKREPKAGSHQFAWLRAQLQNNIIKGDLDVI